MTDADNPRVPDFRWAPVPQWLGAVYVQSRERWYELAVKPDPVDLPADAVKLGDVEESREQIHDLTAWKEDMIHEMSGLGDRPMAKAAREAKRQRDEARDELDGLRADIRAVLDQLDAQRDNPQIRSRMQDGSNAPLHRAFEAGVRYAVGCLRRILDREPGREEPSDPRVFFPGDTVPAWTAVISEHRIFHHEYEPFVPKVFFVEVVKPSPEEWQAIVDRARAARGHVVEHQPEEGR